jgi:hypothetical protein
MLAAAVEAYVAVRRAAGSTFRAEARQLDSFAAFSETRAESRVRASLAIEWAACVRRSETRPVGRSESDPPEGGSFYVLLRSSHLKKEESACGNVGISRSVRDFQAPVEIVL